MNEQARIETAVEATIDNCEVLRLRLAKYEDADGNPKAQPSGVVQWPDADEIMQMAFEEGQPGDDASGYYFELEEFDLFIQRLMEEVARLNQPASAGDDEEEAFEQYARPLGFDLTVPRSGDYIAAQTVLAWEGFKAGAAWQARTALSANHSEQVREGWQLVPVEPQGRQQFNAAFNLCNEFGEVFVRTNEKFAMAVYREMLAAAPSSGSQGGDV